MKLLKVVRPTQPSHLVVLLVTLLCWPTAQAADSQSGERRTFNEHGRADAVVLPAPGSTEPAPLDVPEPNRERSRAAQAPEDSLAAIQVDRIEVLGATVLSAERLDNMLSPYRNRALTVEEISALRLELSETYLREGYVNSGVLVPNQDLAAGTLKLQAVEGQLGDVRVAQGSGLRDAYVRRRINQHLDGPLNINRLQRALTQLQQDPNVARLDARLVPTERLGGSTLELAIEPEQRFAVTVGGDNHRAISVGEERGFVSASLRNLSGWGETLNLYAGTAEGGENYSGSFNLPLGPRLRFSIYGADADAEVIEEQLQSLNIVSDYRMWGTSFSLSLLDTPQRSFGLTAGWEKRSAESTLNGEPYSLSPGAVDGRSRTRSIVAGVDYSRRRAANVLALRATYRHGIGRNGATEFEPAPGDTLALLRNPTGADGRYESWLYQAVFVQRLNGLSALPGLPDRAQLILRGTLQRAADPLMSIEKIAIGGANSVRGFRENLLVRDNGTALTAELQLPIPGYREQPGWRNLVVAPFIDYGRAFDEVNNNAFSSEADSSRDQILVSAGVGVLWQPFRALRAEVYWGESINEKLPEQVARTNTGGSLQGDGIHAAVSLTLNF